MSPPPPGVAGTPHGKLCAASIAAGLVGAMWQQKDGKGLVKLGIHGPSGSITLELGCDALPILWCVFHDIAEKDGCWSGDGDVLFAPYQRARRCVAVPPPA